ncbi:tyrosine-protein phosphatase [Paenibacillus sp.]|uniref:tyrosine-protein phosphatase n=1 Tax=Paenibacillus sp. TaxID=58172 RepID=UPI002D66D8AC|nr:CpsB/CapC family capsule biosynthesis tyrosine phosphatase [Paenibacillus sp.]HZG87590.1 CpsB/CapC family capsule biosynthesis tyrosine phosphatase [Paenibacillus sp.]
MIDIHCHILHGVDDGAQDLDMAVAMARMAVEDGVRTIVATPHFNNVWKVERDTVIAKTKELQAELDRLGIPLSIRYGNELRLENGSFIREALSTGNFCPLNDNPKFVLMEEPWEGFHPDTWDVIEEFRGRGTKIILAHPERHGFFRAEPSLLDRMLATGVVWTQVSAGSLIGEYGVDAQAFAYGLVDRGLAHTLATDAHNMTRKPLLAHAYDAVAARAGAAAADAIRERMRSIAG